MKHNIPIVLLLVSGLPNGHPSPKVNHSFFLLTLEQNHTKTEQTYHYNKP